MRHQVPVDRIRRNTCAACMIRMKEEQKTVPDYAGVRSRRRGNSSERITRLDKMIDWNEDHRGQIAVVNN